MTAAGGAVTAAGGPQTFAAYAYPPNALGYCGPTDHAALLHAAADPGGTDEVRHLAAQFEGAWPYLQLIAGCNGLADPLDRRVVEAYWVGNALLHAVSPAALAASLEERFAPRAGRRFEPLVSAAGTGGVPQHSFHVFAVYPWVGLLRAGAEGPALHVLDRCRIRWGTVVAVRGDAVVVRSRGLSFEGSRLALSAAREEEVRRGLDGTGPVGALAPGDVVSLHWDWVCERLGPRSLRWLVRTTRRNLDAVNALPAPGPAVACGA